MKKSLFVLGTAALLSMASCKKETTVNEVTKDTTVVVTPEAPEVDSTSIKTDSTGTSVEVGKEGVKVNTKNPDGSTKVEVK